MQSACKSAQEKKSPICICISLSWGKVNIKILQQTKSWLAIPALQKWMSSEAVAKPPLQLPRGIGQCFIDSSDSWLVLSVFFIQRLFRVVWVILVNVCNVCFIKLSTCSRCLTGVWAIAFLLAYGWGWVWAIAENDRCLFWASPSFKRMVFCVAWVIPTNARTVCFILPSACSLCITKGIGHFIFVCSGEPLLMIIAAHSRR